MSVLSLAVDPACLHAATGKQPQPKPKPSMMGGMMGSLRVIELQLVAFIMVFSATGLVPLLDLVFPAFATAYVLLLSRLAFPASPAARSRSDGSREIFQGSRLFRAYVVLGTAVGLFFPLAYVLGGFARGDEHALRSATPHLYLLSFQILTENVTSGLGLFSPPVRAMVPLLYTVRRIFVVLDWIHDVWLNKTLPATASFEDVAWAWLGKGLSVANLVYFSVNLFAFLLPLFLPRAFEKYFKETKEVFAKMAEDKEAHSQEKETPEEEKKTD